MAPHSSARKDSKALRAAACKEKSGFLGLSCEGGARGFCGLFDGLQFALDVACHRGEGVLVEGVFCGMPQCVIF